MLAAALLVTSGCTISPLQFGTDDAVTSDLRGADVAEALLVRADGKILLVGTADRQYLPAGSRGRFAFARYERDGSPGTTFGINGVKIIERLPTSTSYYAADAKLQSTGQIIVGGSRIDWYLPEPKWIGVVARFNEDGTPDTAAPNSGFGSTGFANVGFGPLGVDETRIRAVDIAPDGKLIVAGKYRERLGIARLDAQAHLDLTFGDGGKVLADIGVACARDHSFDCRYTEVGDVAVLGDNKILLAGTAFFGTTYDCFVARLTSSGTLDPEFGGAGTGFINVSFGPGDDWCTEMAVQADGRIVLVGTAWSDLYTWNADAQSFGPSSSSIALARFTPDGVLDSGFGTAGKVVDNVTDGRDAGNSVSVAARGEIWVAGHSKNGNETAIIIAKYQSDGTREPTFSLYPHQPNPRRMDLGGNYDQGFATAIQTEIANPAVYGVDTAFRPSRTHTLLWESAFLVAGSAGNVEDSNFALVRHPFRSVSRGGLSVDRIDN